MDPSARIFNDFGKVISQAGGLADGIRQEFESFAKLQINEMLSAMNLVRREEYDTLLEVVQQHSQSIEELKQALSELTENAASAATSDTKSASTSKDV